MKKELLRISIIFFVTVFAVVWALNYIYLGPYKSRASGESIAYTFEPSTINQSTGTFTTTVKAQPSLPMQIWGYEFKINFDITKVRFTGIEYKYGVVSQGLGDETVDAAAINQIGQIAVFGQAQNTTTGLTMPGSPTDIVTVTFEAISSGSSSITTGAGDASFARYIQDTGLIVKIPSAGSVSLSVNGGGGEPSITPGGPTITLGPTVTGGADGSVRINIKLKFQGINGLPATGQNSMLVKFKVIKEGTNDVIWRNGIFTADASGIWSGHIYVPSVDLTSKYRVLVKGAHHIQKRICANNPTEAVPGTYKCAVGNITLSSENNNYNATGILLLVGDLDQSGVVDSVDYGLVKNNLGKKDADILAKADLNRDGIVDTQDFSLILAALSIRTDEL